LKEPTHRSHPIAEGVDATARLCVCMCVCVCVCVCVHKNKSQCVMIINLTTSVSLIVLVHTKNRVAYNRDRVSQCVMTNRKV